MKLAVACRRCLAVDPAVHPTGGLVSAVARSRATVELDRRMVPFSPGAVTSRKPSSRRYRQVRLTMACGRLRCLASGPLLSYMTYSAHVDQSQPTTPSEHHEASFHSTIQYTM
ncbi:hypothetical protein MRX96_008779 [Rhipicephalus microplus]